MRNNSRHNAAMGSQQVTSNHDMRFSLPKLDDHNSRDGDIDGISGQMSPKKFVVTTKMRGGRNNVPA